MTFRPTLEALEDRCTPAGVDVYTFLDANANGVFEPALGETGLLGVLNSVQGKDYLLFQSTVPTGFHTGAGNWYLDVPVGNVWVNASAPDGFAHTTPGTVALDLVFGELEIVYFGFAPLPPAPQQVDVFAFEDFNVNGVWDEDEPGIAGVLIGLATLDGSYQALQTTDANGQTWFSGAPAGTVYASAQVPPDLVLTTPATVPVTQGPGEVTVVYFGFVALFDDLP